MTDIDTAFTRLLLKQIVPTVRKAGKSVFKDAWVWRASRQVWEFHGPDGFYWYGRAYNAYEARYKGWSAWISKRELAREKEAVT